MERRAIKEREIGFGGLRRLYHRALRQGHAARRAGFHRTERILVEDDAAADVEDRVLGIGGREDIAPQCDRAGGDERAPRGERADDDGPGETLRADLSPSRWRESRNVAASRWAVGANAHGVTRGPMRLASGRNGAPHCLPGVTLARPPSSRLTVAFAVTDVKDSPSPPRSSTCEPARGCGAARAASPRRRRRGLPRARWPPAVPGSSRCGS